MAVVIFFFNKESKYGNCKHTSETVAIRSDQTIRNVATAKHDANVLAIVSRELVAAEACFHQSCYRNYTCPMCQRFSFTGSVGTMEYNDIESEPNQKLSDDIRSNIYIILIF